MSCQPLRGGNSIITRGCVPRLVQPPPEESTSDAIVRPRLLYLQSYDTGQQQSLGASEEAPYIREIMSNSPALTWQLFRAGGRENGGHVRSIANVDPTAGQYSCVFHSTDDPIGDNEEQVALGGMFVAMHLRGIVLSQPMNCMALLALAPPFASTASPQVLVRIMPDYTIQIGTLPGGVFTTLAASTVTVPANAWFGLEMQAGVSPFHNDAGGFADVQLYRIGDPTAGVSACRARRVKTRTHVSTDTLSGYAWGTEVVAGAGAGISGVDFDDVHLYGPYGAIKRFISNAYIGAAFPIADGDTIQSSIAFDGHRTEGITDPRLLGIATVFGTSPAYRTLAGVDDDMDAHLGENTVDDFFFGTLSIFTGNWLDGAPFGPAPPDTVKRLQYRDDAMDVFEMGITRPSVASVEGVQPFRLVAFREYIGSVTGPGGEDWNMAGPHVYTALEPKHGTHRMVLKLGGTLALGRVGNVSVPADGVSWGVLQEYTLNPWNVFERDPNGDPWTPTTLRATQCGIRGEPTIAAEDNPDDPWVEFDICQLGHEYSYHTVAINEIEHAPFPPVAALRAYTDEVNLFRLYAEDHSVDWDGSIVSRSIDWGDGSPTEELPANPLLDPGSGETYSWLTHDYAPGTYTVTLTVTDSDGLTDTDTFEFTVANTSPTANFTAENPSGNTIDFTDTSSDPDIGDAITSWLWDFGDGDTSTTQSPSHTYAAPGTYTVVLTVEDENGGSDSFSQDVDVPFAVDPRANMPIVFADSMSAGVEQSTRRYDFQGGTPQNVAAGGRDGRDCVEEGDGATFWEYTVRHNDPHAFQFCFDLQGLTLPAHELPILVVGFDTIVLVLRPDGKLRVYANDGAGNYVNVLETVGAVPATGFVQGTLRFGFGNAGAGFVTLRVNGEMLSADPVAVNPSGSLTIQNDVVIFGTGSDGEFDYSISGYASGLTGVRWCDFAMFDDSAEADHAAYPGDVHFAVSLPQAVGAFNDSGGSAANVQSADEGGSANTFTATNQKDTYTVDTPAGTMATILSVLPFYEAVRGGVVGTKTLAMLLTSGGTTVQSADVSGSSSYTSRFHVASGNTLDRWVIPTDPDTSAAWASAAAIGACEVGLVAVAINAGGTIAVSQLGLEVAYWDT